MATRKQLDPLDALAQGDPKNVIALMLWKARHREPDLYVQIEEKDIAGFEACVEYLKVKPVVKIARPEGLQAQEAIAATGNRRAVPARSATPPKPYVIVTLTDEKGDAIRPVENNEADFDIARDAQQLRRARDHAPELANRIVNQARSGEFSLSDIQDAANALLILSRAV